MDVEGRSLRERVLQAAAVFLALSAFDALRGAVNWGFPLAAAALVFVTMLVLDAVGNRIQRRR